MVSITPSEEILLAYISSYGPPETEITLNPHHVAKDLGYTSPRQIYWLMRGLKIVGVAEIKRKKREWRKSTFIYYQRPERCDVILTGSFRNVTMLRRPHMEGTFK